MTDANRDDIIKETRQEVFDLLRKTIRPEFLNRIDEIIMFNPLTRSEIVQIVGLQLKNVKQLLAKNNVSLNVSDKAVELIATEGYDPQFGARPLKRLIQREILNELSKMILAGTIDQTRPITVDADNFHLVFKN